MGKNGKQQLKRKRPAAAQQNEYLKGKAQQKALNSKQKQKQKRQAAAQSDDDDDDERDGNDNSELREIDELDFDDAFTAGLAFEQLESYEGALASFQAAVKFRPDHLQALSHLADVYATAEQPQKAIKTYLQASKLADADASIWFRLGLTYMSLEQHDAAIESFQRSLAMSVEALDAANDEDDKGEQQDLMKAYSVTLAALANCCGEQGDLDGAIQVYRDAVAKFSSNGNLHYNLATMLMAKGDSVAEAIQSLERAIECSPDTIEFYEDLIEYLEQNKQVAKVPPFQTKLDELKAAAATAKESSEEESEDNEDQSDREEQRSDEA
ncbi:Tpr repeat protein, partial [Globisporangium splendens]